ncbi:MAG TPA: hypothetical protein HPP77_09525 [Candidatus Hydrogenedentes bacterium]|nr:hypothetical protein [Candidatus Hydrogenedentota bacterium]HIJ72874.1 hypothetical protein [Candidatus Hydrogenedentota bacterium]
MAEQRTSPWLRGIVDTLVGASLIRESTIPTKNRLVVILVDTAFETACRAYLKHRKRIKMDKNHERRATLVKTVRSNLAAIDQEVWNTIDYYYSDIRCDFYHESAGKTLSDVDLLDYQETVEFVIDQAFGVQIGQMVRAEFKAQREQQASPTSTENSPTVPLHQLSDKRDKVLLAVGELNPSSSNEVNEYFRRAGDGLRLKAKEFRAIVAANSGTKKFYFYDRDLKRWELSGLGRFRFDQLVKGEPDD